ncbi:polyhydroxyalkanoic acid system family protein [Marinobacter sp. X15-166B]|uniref:polyhydroxyalkanoic acid system family protein n=1 Tax=Marinobacter sp. X15-166B TaxID=1897620 RepID=UPI00085C6BBB|nr:polyhydroxyalkanoic acid system family protein [Marinobacter sp. X15-166B]OEY65658.1 poly(3-hydroxybutyrate) depolymerase [Marinobacter sp. X15-166B]
MSVIEVHRAHRLDHAHAREAAESIARDLSRQFDVDYRWEGDVMRFKRTGVKGQLNITADDIHVHLELGMLLRPFKARIEQEIHHQLDQVVQD